eukprot:CAMPEP_0119514228 /NCGR_PEP_ID=MMETSP1344-20130328/32108_1 /TAXON_ID=236787 /ORGANISM="Florenciella parvula, Strain CCMP2471" /LENGTH=97 /DNA_ID=CAMNT_0007551539 /DNA_START=237 /DNA_END=530 /DNA_ORIENTATION=-
MPFPMPMSPSRRPLSCSTRWRVSRVTKNALSSTATAEFPENMRNEQTTSSTETPASGRRLSSSSFSSTDPGSDRLIRTMARASKFSTTNTAEESSSG